MAQRRYALGPGVVVGSLGVTLASCPIGRMAVRARVTGPIAAVEAVMAFSNPYNEPLDLYFLFALPRGASVSKFKAQLGGRLLEGKVFEKEVAQQHYQIPSLPPFLVNLFSREYAPVFCVSLGKCNPGENITIELAYAQFLAVSDVDFQFRFPLVTSPALVAGASLDGREQDEASPIVASGLKAGPGLSITVQLEVGAIVPHRLGCSQACQVHKLQNGDVSVELSKQNELSARDFIVSYRYGDSRNPQSFLRVGQRHFMLNVIPPWERPQNTLPRDLILLVDISESSDPQRFSVIQALSKALLESLGPGEQFSLVGFNHNVQGYEVGNPCPIDHVPHALNWLSQIKPSGRADMGELWKRVIRMEPQPGRSLCVVLLCSGTVGNEPRIYDATAEEGFNFRICTVGIDNQVNGAFLRRLAASSGGKSMVISSQQPPNLVAAQLVEATRHPLIGRIHWQDHGCAVMMETITPKSPANLSNEPITVFGMRAGDGALAVRGYTYAGAQWEDPVRPVPCLNPAVAFVWASQKVDEMIDELQLLTGPKASKLRHDSLLLCQEYRLLTELSSYVVLEPQVAGADGQPTGVLLPSLSSSDWTTGILDELPSGGERTRLYERRVQLLPPTVEAAAAEAEIEAPPPVKPGLVRADDSEPAATGGLRPKTPILQQKPKHDKSPKVGKGGKVGDKPVFRKNGEQVAKKPQLPRPGIKTEAQSGGGASAGAAPVTGAVAVVDDPPIVDPTPVSPPPMVVSPPTPPPPPPTVEAAPVQPSTTATATATAVAPPVAAPAGDLEPKLLLQQNPELREALMKEMRYLFQVVAKATQGQVDPQIPAYLETILRRIRPLVEQSSGIKEIYRIGVLCYQAIGAKDPQAYLRTQQWVQKFASVF